MANSAVQHPTPALPGNRRLLGRVLGNKVWLPKAFYESLPLIYVLTGLAGLSQSPIPGVAAGLSLLLLAAGIRLTFLRLRFRYGQN